MFKKLLGEKNYFLRHQLPIANVFAIFCGLLSFLFIFSHIKFETAEIEKYFITVFLICIFLAGLLALLMSGVFRILGINLGYKDIYYINKFVAGDQHIISEISTDDLQTLFKYLKSIPNIFLRRTTFYTGAVILISAITMFFTKTSPYNVMIILIGGFIAGIAPTTLFVRFFLENSSRPVLRECRGMLIKRGIEPEEKISLSSLKNILNYFVILIFLISIIILSFVSNLNILILAIPIVAIGLIVIISRAIFSSIHSVIQEIKDFAVELPKEKKVNYVTGSSFEEIIGLSKYLNGAAEEVYKSRIMEKKAREDLKELDWAKTQFILTTEHHLRTPLTISKGYLNNLLTEENNNLSEKQKSYLEKINNATIRVIDLVNELLEISQMEVGKSILKLEPASIKDLIIDIINNSKSDMDVKQIKPIFYFPEETNVLNLNKEKMNEALSNLISNAVKYNKTGGEIKVIGKIITNEENKKFYQISIEDQGIGIKKEGLDKIFTQYFERGEEARKVYATGRGIGLVIAKNIVKAHQGTIRVESEGEGKGSRFIIELPI